MKSTKSMLFIVILTLWGLTGVVTAQGGVITYGETRSETLSDASPQILYSLNGNEDEVMTVYALGWSNAFQPSITVLGPTGQLAFTTSDALSPIPNDARATVRLPATGNYSILIGSANNVFDTFTVAVRLTTPGISTQLGADPVTLDIPPGGQSQTFTILAAPDADTPISITSGTPGFLFAAHIIAPDGRIVMAVDGALSSVNAVLPASPEPYTLIVQSSNPSEGGTLSIAQSGSAPVPTTDGQSPAPVVTEEINTGNTPPADRCSVIAGPSGVNLRSGPGTEYDAIGGLAPNAYLVVIGQNNGWYTGESIYGTAWIAGSVVTLSGPCDNLPFVDASPAPAATQAPPTATYTYTPTTTDDTGDTGTITEATPTATYTYTPTVTATESVQIAPIDSDQLNLAVDRDTGGQYTNDVSYPDGDTTDRLRITIDNLTNQTPNNYRELNIIVTCFGEGAENLRWGSGGPGSPTSKGCNESLAAVHTNDSNQTFLNINMTGNGYVTYTVVVTVSS